MQNLELFLKQVEKIKLYVYQYIHYRPKRINGHTIIEIPSEDDSFSIYFIKALDPSYVFLKVQAESFMLETRYASL